MAAQYTVSLAQIIEEFSLEIINCSQEPSTVTVCKSDVNRPGLQFVGFYEFFDEGRIQILGISEINYLNQLDVQEQTVRLDAFFSRRPVAVLVARNQEVSAEIRAAAERYQVPLLRTGEDTSAITASLISWLKVRLAPRVTRHGVMVEVYGEGILMLGESGVGKSETAIELIKRGHRLIADDAVEIRRVSSNTLVGAAPDNIRHYIELRGIGIINARRIFGIGSVKLTEKVDLVVNLEQWDAQKVYDRLGLENQTTEILGLHVPSLTIPVKPGRNLAVIIEVAAMNNRQKRMGFNSAQELLHQLHMDGDVSSDDRNEPGVWSEF